MVRTGQTPLTESIVTRSTGKSWCLRIVFGWTGGPTGPPASSRMVWKPRWLLSPGWWRSISLCKNATYPNARTVEPRLCGRHSPRG